MDVEDCEGLFLCNQFSLNQDQLEFGDYRMVHIYIHINYMELHKCVLPKIQKCRTIQNGHEIKGPAQQHVLSLTGLLDVSSEKFQD